MAVNLKKVGVSVVKGQMKLWGGDKVPYLNNSVNAISKWIVDPSSFMAEYKLPPTDQQKVKMTMQKMERDKKELVKYETELHALKGVYSDIIDKTALKVLEIVCINADAFKTNSLYAVTPNLLKRLDLTSVKDLVFYDINRQLLPKVTVEGYLGMIKAMRDMEIKALTLLNKLNTINRSLQQDRQSMANIVEDIKKKKKKK